MTWGEWPDEARATWDRAVWMWEREHPGLELPGRKLNPWRPNRGAMEEREASWAAVLSLGGGGWPDLPHVSWAHLAAKMHLGHGATVHHFRMLGWQFDGRFSERRVIEAPCVPCGKVWGAERIQNRIGPCCQRKRR